MPSRSPTGASFGALPTARTTTSSAIRRPPARISPTSIRKRTSTMCRTSSSRRSAVTAWRSRSCATLTTRRSWTRRKTTCAPFCICTRRLRRSSARCCRSRRSSPPPRPSFITSCRRNSWWTMTTPVPSASATAVRTRSARPTASPWTSRPWATRKRPPTAASRYASVTAWSRSASPSPR